ncbi:radical SAM family heme chaperone HemW [bacterium]|nr:radical SAM family heme chaperone HemW [bacterium]
MDVLPPCEGDSYGVYLHIPFCVRKCPYCDFVSWSVKELASPLRNRTIEALHLEIRAAFQRFPHLRNKALASIYLGGGTPSLLDPQEVHRLISSVLEESKTPLSPDIEITLECNPASGETTRLAAFQIAGVNRISLGAQSFQDRVLEALGRAHSAEDVFKTVDAIRDENFSSWGLDLIFSAPGSSLEEWRRDLAQAIAVHPPHLSIYGLTLHEGTPFFQDFSRGLLDLPPEEAQREMFLAARQLMTEAGYNHYEISNYALPGHHSRHNSLYWDLSEYLGLGVAAHSFVSGVRYANSRDLETHLSRTESDERTMEAETPPSLRSRRAERIMLALRRCEGIEIERLDRWLGCDFQKEYAPEILQLIAQDWLRIEKGRTDLTLEGLLMSDRAFEEFF